MQNNNAIAVCEFLILSEKLQVAAYQARAAVAVLVRKEKGFTQRQLASKAKVIVGRVVDLEAGRWLKYGYLARIYKALDIFYIFERIHFGNPIERANIEEEVREAMTCLGGN